MNSFMIPPFLVVDYHQHFFDFTQLSSRPPGCPGILAGRIQNRPNALPLPSRQFPTHPSHSFTPRRGRSLTSNLLQTAPPTLPTQNADAAGGGNGSAGGNENRLPPSPQLLAAIPNCTPELPSHPNPIRLPFEDVLDKCHVALHPQTQHRQNPLRVRSV